MDPKKLGDETLKDAVKLGHMGLGMAWNGDLEKHWVGLPQVEFEGRLVSQKECFFLNVSRWLPEAEREALARKLHLK